ncbi:hypothetical protein SAMN05443432_101557 [Roseovarius litoreus]|uniref:Uncharacterized protein n=1 Tax=Roseovarius litoreus TaxID=1155722 RepID=A0A1M7ASL4_9RHOB|nr:hypothetical protein [Roseovarius litoreus]SHL45616.1 hypothetical protein SAMN05443432_101557 [Roseovarius litoreus]
MLFRLSPPVPLRLDRDEFWFSTPDSDLQLWLEGVNVGLGHHVETAELDMATVQIQGPKSEELMEAEMSGQPVAAEVVEVPFRPSAHPSAREQAQASGRYWDG